MPHKPPAEAGGVTRGDHERGIWANGRKVLASVIPLASARGFWVGVRRWSFPIPPDDSVTMRVSLEVTMSVDIQIETMSVAEKVQLLESVWQSLCTHPGDVRSPEWHREVLEERRRRLEDGRATISAWADAKARLMQLGR